MSEFIPFPKIPRLKRGVVITEKIDGTNASVHLQPKVPGESMDSVIDTVIIDGVVCTFRCASRKRWIVPGDDNYGFAKWANDNSYELFKLGIGSHFGEWWGSGIQRRYGINEKRFSLFNVGRWTEETLPECCHTVPTLWEGEYDDMNIDAVMEDLAGGSQAAPGFLDPEGIIVYLTAARQSFKVTYEHDTTGKDAAQN